MRLKHLLNLKQTEKNPTVDAYSNLLDRERHL